MRTTLLILFFTLVLLVYGAINSYIFIRGLQAIPSESPARVWFSSFFWFFASAFIVARILERVYPSTLSGVITWIGSFWLGFMLFFFLAVVFIDLIRLLHGFWPFLPECLTADSGHVRLALFWTVFGVSSLLVVGSYLNARNPYIHHLDITIEKPNAVLGDLTIVMASDIHLGTIIASRKANRLVHSINALHPDIVLFAGDIVDEDLAPVIQQNLGEALSRIEAPLGVYGVTGNHEYIGGAGQAVNYLEEHGILMLRDTAVFVDNRFFLIGREDRDKGRFTGLDRKPLAHLLEKVDHTFPIILMDHQPFDLQKHADSGIDLQVSGHTHHGQLWPLNYLTSAIFEVSHGYKQIGKSHFYVSTGYGTWGPPLRLGNRPEIVEITVHFQ